MNSFRDILRRDLEGRKLRNPSYSLRAYAQFLEMAPGQLSEVLSGKKGISIRRAKSWLRRLKLTDLEENQFMESVASLCHRNHLSRTEAQAELEKLEAQILESHQLTEDQFQVIAGWLHFALLALAGTPGFQSDPRWISQQLNVTVREVSEALERLCRLGLFQKTDSGFEIVQGLQFSPRGVPSRAVRFHHRQIFLKAMSALEREPVHHRNFEETTCAFRPEDLPEIRKRQANFLQSIYKEFGTRSHRTRVYSLGAFMFPLSGEQKSQEDEVETFMGAKR